MNYISLDAMYIALGSYSGSFALSSNLGVEWILCRWLVPLAFSIGVWTYQMVWILQLLISFKNVGKREYLDAELYFSTETLCITSGDFYYSIPFFKYLLPILFSLSVYILSGENNLFYSEFFIERIEAVSQLLSCLT